MVRLCLAARSSKLPMVKLYSIELWKYDETCVPGLVPFGSVRWPHIRPLSNLVGHGTQNGTCQLVGVLKERLTIRSRKRGLGFEEPNCDGHHATLISRKASRRLWKVDRLSRVVCRQNRCLVIAASLPLPMNQTVSPTCHISSALLSTQSRMYIGTALVPRLRGGKLCLTKRMDSRPLSSPCSTRLKNVYCLFVDYGIAAFGKQ